MGKKFLAPNFLRFLILFP